MKKENDNLSLMPKNYDEAKNLAEMVAMSDFAPKAFKNKPNEVLIAMQLGNEIGLKPLQSIQNIAVINGRPSIWGDAVMALVRSHPHCEYVSESFDDKTMTARCVVKRKGQPEHIETFDHEDASRAGLLGKAGPWTLYPKRMLKMRARGFAIRDVFADALKGLILAEESEDIPCNEIDVTPSKRCISLVDELSTENNIPSNVTSISKNSMDTSAKYHEIEDLFMSCTTIEDLTSMASHLAESIKDLNDSDQDALKEIWRDRKAEISEEMALGA